MDQRVMKVTGGTILPLSKCKNDKTLPAPT
jgi:hypothetical protein